jgi:hypothetical protein
LRNSNKINFFIRKRLNISPTILFFLLRNENKYFIRKLVVIPAANKQTKNTHIHICGKNLEVFGEKKRKQSNERKVAG